MLLRIIRDVLDSDDVLCRIAGLSVMAELYGSVVSVILTWLP